jgi:hypothetical protein
LLARPRKKVRFAARITANACHPCRTEKPSMDENTPQNIETTYTISHLHVSHIVLTVDTFIPSPPRKVNINFVPILYLTPSPIRGIVSLN